MSLIIHKVLFEKLSSHPEWGKFRDTYRVLSGHDVALLEQLPRGRGKPLSARIDVRGILVGVLVADEKGIEARDHEKACQHLLSMAAERFASILSESHVHDHERLPAVVLKTCKWIRSQAFEHEVRLTEAAEACGLSESHLSRLFHRSTGMTFQEYVRRCRLEEACKLLTTTDRSITRVAFESGFQSISQFHRSFRAVYKERPLEYRKQHSGAGT
jgi:AraC-like DNA-binding protein